MKKWFLPLSFLVALSCYGCTAPLAFTSPCPAGPDPNNNNCAATAPVSGATISFASTFDPSNSLTVTFDGQTITNSLKPYPAS
jgi:hypothetical protein